MAFSFTRAALRDKYLEDVSVVLENGLVDGRFWLPYRQEIEIRRTGSWMDFPSRGIIRGRWEICCARTNTGMSPAVTMGPEIVQAPPEELRAYPFTGALLTQLPADVTLATDDDVRAVQDAAREMVRAEALSRARATNPSARSISDLVRVNRVEGLALGVGLRRALGLGVEGTLRLRYGTANRNWAGALALAWRRADGAFVALRSLSDFADAGDEAEVSGVRNSLAAQEFGADYTDPYQERSVSLTAGFAPSDGWRWSATAERRRESALAVHATPSTGRYEPTPSVEPLTGWRFGVEARRAARPVGRATVGLRATLFAERDRVDGGGRAGQEGWTGRGSVTIDASRPAATGTLVSHTIAAALAGGFALAPQRLVRIGGPVTGPGFDYHQFTGRAALSQRFEWQRAIPFVPLRFGRFGKVPSTLTLAPFAMGLWVDGQGGAAHGWHGSVGLGVLALFDQLRLDVARGGRGGRWTFSVDVSSALWPIM
jgi:hypothetical protein